MVNCCLLVVCPTNGAKLKIPILSLFLYLLSCLYLKTFASQWVHFTCFILQYSLNMFILFLFTDILCLSSSLMLLWMSTSQSGSLSLELPLGTFNVCLLFPHHIMYFTNFDDLHSPGQSGQYRLILLIHFYPLLEPFICFLNHVSVWRILFFQDFDHC